MTDTTKLNKSTEIKPVHELIDSAIITNKPAYVPLHEIAERCGLLRSGSKTVSPVMSMLRNGSMRLPMDKVIVVADELNIDRRVLFTALLRDTIYGLMVKSSNSRAKADETEEEKKQREKAEAISHRLQVKEFERVWGEIASLMTHTHSESEAPIVEAMREVSEEIGHEIKPDTSLIADFKNLLRDRYAL
ncbi:hypothetical protein [Vibrio fluvialis]|uniref:hypothetical protein n=1 Tax=Vibrio fluvialis TaxID=676 RepID=UPI0037DA7A6A